MDFLVVPIAWLLRRTNPNHVTLIGFLCVLPAAYFFWQSTPATELTNHYLILGAALVFVHGILDLVDGAVAKTYGKATPLGDFLDHVSDRVSDTIILAALAFSAWGDIRIGLLAIVATLLSSYLGTQAQAVGAGRMYTGLLARADRLVLLMVVPVVDHVLLLEGVTFDWMGVESALGLVLWYIALGGIVTGLQRFVQIYRYLVRNPKKRGV